jgi:hypothetical protein
MFKSKEDEIGYDNLVKDYHWLCSITSRPATRLVEGGIDGMIEGIENEIYSRFNVDFFDKTEAWLVDHPLEGSLDGFIAAVHHFRFPKNENPQYIFHRESILIDLYGRWLDKNGLPHVSADELVVEHDLITVSQYKWLIRFIKVWSHYASNRGSH